jgi:hypothetical protein
LGHSGFLFSPRGIFAKIPLGTPKILDREKIIFVFILRRLEGKPPYLRWHFERSAEIPPAAILLRKISTSGFALRSE